MADGIGPFGTRRVSESRSSAPGDAAPLTAILIRRVLTVVCPVCAVRQVAGFFLTALGGPHQRTPRAVLPGVGGSRSGGVSDVATASHNYGYYVG